MFALCLLNSDWWTWLKPEKLCWSPWGYSLTLGFLICTLDMTFQGVSVVALILCLSLDGVVHPRAKPGFGPTRVGNALTAPSSGWNCTDICLIIQSSWARNELGWNNQVCRGSTSSEIYQDLTDSRCCDLGFFMSWKSGRVFLEFLPSWGPEGSDQTVHVSHHWWTGCILYFGHRAVKSCSWLFPQTVWGTAQPLWYFPSKTSDQQVISWKLCIIGELPKLGTFNFYLLFSSPKIYRRSLILFKKIM